MIRFEKQGHIGILTVSRPEALNALNSEALDGLLSTVQKIADDISVRALIVTGEGKAFVAGADIAEMKDLDADAGRGFGLRGQAALSAVEALPMPVIAAVNGYALGGGCELALCADIRIASEKARFGQPEVGLGITPGFGGTQRLPRVIGVSKAMDLILTGRTVKADEALAMGLVDRVVPPDELMPEALKLAGLIAANAPFAVRASKRAIRRFTDAGQTEGLLYEAEMFGECFATNGQKMAMEAFVNKAPKDEFIDE
ncbi:MAG: enoyl-CoA hydratase/isomerase family protein [Clostridia bacterium]|nr:enoyl-CoA hydratase/isomerase family protein [Clostridia bacterium]MBR6428201.1 enoyl-CoA hydratase/isomerase family protein [Clostridia bacterium]